ncbi:hypothetical protein DUNSADRAFT_6817 [Dunaliella salina]|uniref:Uncharacterized protein n=1 Tax=Dunaliella salina TaxID=3046 RepID=A0ABQ7GMJ9_DUNSA|nr:hypothetical protein DUNSADRAFT_6817 [Dunaliella salina]|eukprot:KAF5835830.1 hypothetical protein DUNSADRAFT_6817 [Dunaliella salina]
MGRWTFCKVPGLLDELLNASPYAFCVSDFVLARGLKVAWVQGMGAIPEHSVFWSLCKRLCIRRAWI